MSWGVLISCVLGIVWAGSWSAATLMAEVVDKIVAVVGDEVILLSEVREHAVNPATRAVANLSQVADIESATLDYMIERQILAREVQYLAFPREKAVVKTLAVRYVVKMYYQQDTEAFSETVQAEGVTANALEEELAVYMQGMDYVRRKYRFSEDVEEADTVLRLFEEWLDTLKAQAAIQRIQ